MEVQDTAAFADGGRAGWVLAGRRVRSSSALATPAPVAQRIEHRPPEPVAQVRVLPGALGTTIEPSKTGCPALLVLLGPDSGVLQFRSPQSCSRSRPSIDIPTRLAVVGAPSFAGHSGTIRPPCKRKHGLQRRGDRLRTMLRVRNLRFSWSLSCSSAQFRCDPCCADVVWLRADWFYGNASVPGRIKTWGSPVHRSS